MVLVCAHHARGHATGGGRLLLLAKVLVLGATQLDTVWAHLAPIVVLAVRFTFELEIVAILQRARTIATHETGGVVLRADGRHTNLVDNVLVAAATDRRKQLHVARPTIALAVVLVVALGVVRHHLVAVLAREVLQMEGLAQCGEAFLVGWDLEG